MDGKEQHQAAVLSHVIREWGEAVLNGAKVEVPTWQALDVRGKAQGTTIEQTDCTVRILIPQSIEVLKAGLNPSLPWAENQFQERVSGEPLNPGETFKEWPWYRGNVEQHKAQGKFSHTYMERYWPKDAYDGNANPLSVVEEIPRPMGGIRFQYGDLNDVVNLLAREPATRQAYLPVFFPEDTGAVHGQRIPCSLGYLFLIRENKLNVTYYIRSCDFYRHFRDDVYMTARLCQWVCEQLAEKDVHYGIRTDHPVLGRLTMHIGSLHVFEGDLPRLRREYGDG